MAIKSEEIEDTFKDTAVYSTLAMILFRKGQEKGEYRRLEGDLEPVDEKYNGDGLYEHPIIAMRRMAEEQQGEEERSNAKIVQEEIQKIWKYDIWIDRVRAE